MSRRNRGLLWIAWLIWGVVFVVAIGLLLEDRLDAIPYQVYAASGRHWLAGQPLYETQTIDGFQYLPTTALLFAPFAYLGSPAGDIAWRALSWGLYAFGIWRVVRRVAPLRVEESFVLATCLAAPPAIGALGNGQANLALGALMLHTTAELVARRWWRVTAILALGFGLKPLMLVLLLLVWALYRPMTFRIPLGLAPVLLAPWLWHEPSYVQAQYANCVTKLLMCSQPDRLFEDGRSLLTTLGFRVPPAIAVTLQLVAALSVLAIGLDLRRRAREPYASLVVVALSASYLMLCNPRTLATSYLMVASTAALLAVTYLTQGRPRAAATMIAFALSWNVNRQLLPWTEHWLKPLLCIWFSVVLVRDVWSSRAPKPLHFYDRRASSAVTASSSNATLP